MTEVPEKFAGMPPGTRAVQLPDGEANHPFLKTFGQPARELACECEREGDSNLAQALQLINGPAVNERLRNPNNRIGKLLAAKKTDKEILNELFLVALSRPPSAVGVQGVAGPRHRLGGQTQGLGRRALGADQRQGVLLPPLKVSLDCAKLLVSRRRADDARLEKACETLRA